MPSEDRPSIVLASASPRRRELLARLGLVAEVRPADVDESTLPGETAAEYVLRVAADKAHVVAALEPGRIVVAADTAVVHDGEPLGKPVDAADAIRTLERLAGTTHEVMSAVVVIDPDGIEHSALSRTTVTMAPSDDDERAWYVATGEPMDKAGSYAVQGAGAVLVERVEGDPTTVIGLPLRTTIELLRTAGLEWPTRF